MSFIKLIQVINGEKSAFNNSVFGKRRKRTLEAIINNIYEKENIKVGVWLLCLLNFKWRKINFECFRTEPWLTRSPPAPASDEKTIRSKLNCFESDR